MSDVSEARRQAAENVGADLDLTPQERETTFRFAEDQDVADVFVRERGLMRRFLLHPEATIQFVSVHDGNVGGTATPLREYDGGRVVGVKASLPVGCLTVRGDPRTSGTHADVVTKRVLTNGGDPA